MKERKRVHPAVLIQFKLVSISKCVAVIDRINILSEPILCEFDHFRGAYRF